jgi:glycolate oxidase FAD binding subunit
MSMTRAWRAEDLAVHVPRARILVGGDVDGVAVDGVRPAAVVQPADIDETAAVLRFSSERGLAVTPRGGGTMLDLGSPPERLDLVLDLGHLDRIVEHQPQDLTVTVEAGVLLGDLQSALGRHAQMLAIDPPCAERATVGGVLATNGHGPRRQRYGTARDLLIGSRVLLSDGTPVRAGGKVVKNVAGYDLNKLWIGSAGTLAVIVEATFKLTPVPAEIGMLVAAFGSLDEAHAAALEVARGRLQPLTLDLISPPVAGRLTHESRAERSDDTWLLAAELGGDHPTVERATRELTSMAMAGGSTGVTALEAPARERLMQRLRDFGRSAEDPASWILRMTVLPSETAEAIRAVQSEAGDPQPSIIARAGSGVVYIYWDEVEDGRGVTMVRRVRELIAHLDGSAVVERAPARVKSNLDIWGLQGPDLDLMQRVKAAYDPAGVLSPGRVV